MSTARNPQAAPAPVPLIVISTITTGKEWSNLNVFNLEKEVKKIKKYIPPHFFVKPRKPEHLYQEICYRRFD
jgi:hypothetical protein